ncbi:Uncharacterised protein [Edwardsiella tarda]|uniref:Uncharacterized protein n=1 Tax=Edwardsiella tarda ATCC 15947 = NBRC 105688 TaxID=667121 RepID=A0AC61TFL0_EDWTA|nr:hypothetical protein [Edwardsiella tarda]UAL58101.1 hypothetical protein K8O98_05925 [Edwardsiella tarda]UCP99493.1 hypothetical protein DCL27_12595 [Edwardsiella tarda ATCC 15947 = NBRC 105688]STD30407.1 Uncharacterised protein [Edwardsiella tarda]
MATITKERLLKIKRWREKFGAGSNVMLPAEEAEELARIALAALEAEPVAYLNRFTGRSFELEQQPGADKDPTVYIPLYTAPIAPVLPDGYVLVPIEPTMAMLDEFDSIIDHGAEDSKDAWSRLIASAPKQEANND